MAHFTTAALEHLERHHGVATPDRLRSLGMTSHAIRTLRSVGNLEQVLRGVYRTPAVPFDEAARCAAVSARFPDSAISDVTAGRLWDFRRLPNDSRIHIVSPPGSQHSTEQWIVQYRTAAIHHDDIVVRPDGIRLTTRARTAFDLARRLTSLNRLSVVEQAMHDGGLTDEDMRRVAVDWISPQRPWIFGYLGCLGDRLQGGAAESHLEVELGDALRAAGITTLVRQHRIELPGFGLARFDLACPDIQWAIEVDGFPTHRETQGRRSDVRRDAAATEAGWTTTRIAPDDLGSSLPATVLSLATRYAQLRAMSPSATGPHPNSPPGPEPDQR